MPLIAPLSLGLAFLFAGPTLAKDEYKICSITINSDDEIELYKKELAGEENISFEELIPRAEDRSRSENWLAQACRSMREAATACDTLVISGHFGGTFFGSSGMNLSLGAMERASCSNECEEIFRNPLDVFLFGCNTLAGKEKDARTPEQYLQVLLNDGIARPVAEQVVQARYGAFGQSNKERMQRVFREVPQIKGFSSIGPSGKNVKSFLKKYIADKKKKHGSYAEYLGDLENKRAVELGLKSLSAAVRLNTGQGKPALGLDTEWTESMKVTAHAQCSGVLGEQSEAQQKFCEIFDPKISLTAKLMKVESVLSSTEGLTQFQTIHEFFNAFPVNSFTNKADKETLARIRDNKGTRTRVVALLDAIKGSPVLSMELMLLSHEIGWIDEADYKSRMNTFLKKSLRADLSTEEVDTVCSQVYERDFSDIAYAADIPDKFYENPEILRLLGCMKAKDTEIVHKVAARLKSEKAAVARAALQAIKEILPADPLVHTAVAEHVFSKRGDFRREVFETLRELAPQDPAITKKLVEVLDQKDADFNRTVLSALEAIAPKDPAVVRKMAESLKGTGFLRDRAIKVLVRLSKKQPAVSDLIQEIFDSSDDNIRAAALAAQADGDSQADGDKITTVLQEKILAALTTLKLDASAIVALLDIATKHFPDASGITPVIINSLKSDNNQVQAAAVRALSKKSKLSPAETEELTKIKDDAASYDLSTLALTVLFGKDSQNASLQEDMAQRISSDEENSIRREVIAVADRHMPAHAKFRSGYLKVINSREDSATKFHARKALEKFSDLTAEERAALGGTAGSEF